MNRRKKSFIGVALIICLLSSSIVLATSFPQKNDKWMFLDEKYYRVLPYEGEDTVLFNRLQARDYEETLEELIDTSIKPLTEKEMERYENLDVFAPSSLLPDGRFLVGNWPELQNELLQGHLIAYQMKKQNLNEANVSFFTVEVDSFYGPITVRLKKINTENEDVVMPVDPDDCPTDYQFANGSLFLANEKGLWIVDPQSEQANPISYDKEQYELLTKANANDEGELVVKWATTIHPSPKNGKVAFLSNRNLFSVEQKETFAGFEDEIFWYDFQNNEEICWGMTPGVSYRINGWLDEEHLICTELRDSHWEIICISSDGRRDSLHVNGQFPYVYGVKNDVIAYVPTLNDAELHLVRYSLTDKLKDIQTATLGEGTRLRPGLDSFNLSGKYFASLFVPEGHPKERMIALFDTVNGELSIIEIPKEIKKADERIYEFTWADNSTLIIVLKNAEGTLSSWRYYL